MLIISDTSPITNLIQLDLLLLLKELFNEIIIPKTVYLELCEYEYQKEIIDKADWIQIKTVTNQDAVTELMSDLDLGEAEAIILSKELNADYLIIDERKGRNTAKNEGLHIIGLLGVLIIAKQKKMIPELKSILQKLMNEIGFRIHYKLYLKVLEQVDEME